MQTIHNPEYLLATFIRELKNRFLCEVEINGKSVVCYVPSSCHLSNFLSLEGKQVLLVPTQANNARTKFSLFAVPYKNSYILLNSSLANRAIENNIHSRRFSSLGMRKSVIKEHSVEGYKSDLFIEDTSTVIEIKSVLSLDAVAKFPTVYSERSLEQLYKLRLMLKNGYKVHYMIVSLNPYVKKIYIPNNTEFSQELNDCIAQGMKISAYSCRLNNQVIKIKHELPITIQLDEG